MESDRQTGTMMGTGGGFWGESAARYPSRGRRCATEESPAGKQALLGQGTERDPLADYPAHPPPSRSSILMRHAQADRLDWAWPLQTRKCVGDCCPGDATGLGQHSREQRGSPDCGLRSCSPGWPEWRSMAWKQPLMLGSLRSKGWTQALGLDTGSGPGAKTAQGPGLPWHSPLASILTSYFETQKRANKIPPASG